MSIKQNIDCVHILQLAVDDRIQWHQPIAIEHECYGLVFVYLQFRLVSTCNVNESSIL